MLGEALIVVLLKPCLTRAATLFHVKSRCQQRDPPEYPISPTELSLKTGTRQCPITGRCQTDAGERVMMREMHVAGLRWGREAPGLSDSLACFAPGEKGGLACLAAVAQLDRDVLKMPMHGWHVKSRVGLGRVETSVKISFSLPSNCLA
ncbi:hypothetical protein B0J15DRAFT_149178 [Fusarium solani]|uniref:Uncharacterized protein n=1 Tax=Fusarium solani TaxID=169388 RepID=A0A9P9GBZ3_FUSSL|nr:uncharacterized protein B0J15DRAFT_149178 [Fusarium solani]KAH7235179.1 hypothetical protein B0J15DRAFT_149178 [Fusarium solani]